MYEKIIRLIPIVCVDGFVFNNLNQILLLKRNNEPAKGEWWVPGGRIFKNEPLTVALKRKIREELGLDIENFLEIGVVETIFEEKHTINICYKINLHNEKIKLNDEHEFFEWFNIDRLPQNLNQVIKNKILQISQY